MDGLFWHPLSVLTSKIRGTQFISPIWGELCQLLNVRHAVTAPYHLEASRMVERFHCRLEYALCAR